MKVYSQWKTLLAAGVFSLSLFCCLSITVSAQPADSDYMLYEMKEADTLRSLAEQFFGGEQYLHELIRYNALSSPHQVRVGDMLAIPLDVRNRAVAGLSKADQAVSIALTTGAEKFASEAYQHALTTLQQARDARESASYARSIALADLAIVRSQAAIAQADKLAPVQQNASVVAAHGKIDVSTDQGKTWAAAKVGQELPVPCQIRTGSGARAEIGLADDSVIQMMESSTFEVRDFLFDRRDGIRRSRMKVILGSILGRIAPKKHEKSTFEIETEAAAVAIRGTVLRVGADETKATRLSVLEGRTQLEAGGAAKDVPDGFGSKTEMGQRPGAVKELLPAPLPLSPINSFQTGRQELTFSWEKLRARGLGGYHFELARDEAFNDVVKHGVIEQTQVQSGVLEKGTYFWRVSSLDKSLLEGLSFNPQSFTVELRLDVSLIPQGKFWTDGERIVLGPGAGLTLKAMDGDSSVHHIQARIGKEKFADADKPLRFAKEGKVTIQARGVSQTGEKGKVKKVTAWVDHSAPKVNVKLVPVPGGTGHPAYEMHLVAVDDTEVLKTEYQLNREPYKQYTGPVSLDPFISYDVSFRAEDHVGNRSPVNAIHVMSGWPDPSKF